MERLALDMRLIMIMTDVDKIKNVNCSFDSTNGKVIAFYEQFQSVFQRIDVLFKKISNRGGKDLPIAEEILDILIDYHMNEHVLDEEINTIKSIEAFYKLLKEFQSTLHDALISNSLMTDSLNISDKAVVKISGMLIWLKNNINNAEKNTTDYYASLHILRELVSDYSLFTKGLQALAPWNYGTRPYSMLSADEQLVLILNQAILIDRMYFCLDSFETILMRLNSIIDSFDELNWTVYYIVGLLNYKIHNYNLAHKYLKNVEINTSLIDSDNSDTRYKYFHSLLLIVYSYEYDGKFSEAIEKMAINPREISDLLNNCEIWDLDKEDTFNSILENICKLAVKENPLSLFNLFLPSFTDFCGKIKNIGIDNKETIDKQFEILHSFAHCLNEYAISERQKNYSNDSILSNTKLTFNYGKIIHLARCILSYISQYRPYYRTCYATIHGECQDYTVALKELDATDKIYEEKIIQSKQNELDDCELMRAEISFYKYYFNLLINENSNKAKESFEQYCRKYDDGDAECYLKIFEFRNELRKHLMALFNSINELIGDGIPFSEENLPSPTNMLVEKYNDLCQLRPTLYLNINVRAELRLVQRAYVCVEKLREYLISPSLTTLARLKNAGQRFLSKNVCLDEVYKQNLPTDLPYSISATFSIYRPGIFNRLFNNDSIFILAPISEVKGFEYQTGKVGKLFAVNNILPTFNEKPFDSIKLIDFASKLHNCFIDYSEQYRINILFSDKWQEIRKFVEEIFYWNSAIPAQILVAKFHANYKMPDLFSRQIQDVSHFIDQLNQKHISFENQIKTKCTKRGVDYIKVPCSYQKTELPKMEIVNEKCLNNSEFIIFWLERHDNNSNNLPSCFILRKKHGANCDKHQLHKLIFEIKPSEYPEDVLSSKAGDYSAATPNDIEIDKIFKMIEQFSSRVRPVLEKKINNVSNELFSSSREGELYKLLQKSKEELENHLSILIKYSEPDAKHRYNAQEHKDHLEELNSKEPEMIG